MPKIRPESPLDRNAIETLLDVVFGKDRHNKVSYRYRDGVDPVAGLSRIAHDGGDLVGTIQYWPISIGADKTPALLLGPIAVSPDRKGQGIGIRLILETLESAAAGGTGVVVLVGELPYYARFGFVPAQDFSVIMPDEAPERVQILFLNTDLKGKVSGQIEKAGQETAGVA